MTHIQSYTCFLWSKGEGYAVCVTRYLAEVQEHQRIRGSNEGRKDDRREDKINSYTLLAGVKISKELLMKTNVKAVVSRGERSEGEQGINKRKEHPGKLRSWREGRKQWFAWEGWEQAAGGSEGGKEAMHDPDCPARRDENLSCTTQSETRGKGDP